ncbi:MAG TPA: hypothetical protein PLU22_06435, partial [Polyangiaceae bacterium]|nr:hypothetical protein [Polyangiaceae bacterium]
RAQARLSQPAPGRRCRAPGEGSDFDAPTRAKGPVVVAVLRVPLVVVSGSGARRRAPWVRARRLGSSLRPW